MLKLSSLHNTDIIGHFGYQGNTQQSSRDDETNLGALLSEFFKFYGFFNYKTMAVRAVFEEEGPFVMKEKVGNYLYKK